MKTETNFNSNGYSRPNRIFVMPDGKVFRVNTYEELATKMRESSFFPEIDLNAYMLAVAKRTYIMHGITITAWTPDNFIRDLLHYKIIEELFYQ